MLKKPWICGACRSIVSNRSVPDATSKSATSFDEMGTRGLSLRSCRAYPKYGSTAVIRFAEARLNASIIRNSSMRFESTGGPVGFEPRSEEHTSELQSPYDLV